MIWKILNFSFSNAVFLPMAFVPLFILAGQRFEAQVLNNQGISPLVYWTSVGVGGYVLGIPLALLLVGSLSVFDAFCTWIQNRLLAVAEWFTWSKTGRVITRTFSALVLLSLLGLIVWYAQSWIIGALPWVLGITLALAAIFGFLYICGRSYLLIAALFLLATGVFTFFYAPHAFELLKVMPQRGTELVYWYELASYLFHPLMYSFVLLIVALVVFTGLGGDGGGSPATSSSRGYDGPPTYSGRSSSSGSGSYGGGPEGSAPDGDGGD